MNISVIQFFYNRDGDREGESPASLMPASLAYTAKKKRQLQIRQKVRLKPNIVLWSVHTHYSTCERNSFIRLLGTCYSTQQYFSWIYPREQNLCSEKYLNRNVWNKIFKFSKNWKQPKCPSTIKYTHTDASTPLRMLLSKKEEEWSIDRCSHMEESKSTWPRERRQTPWLSYYSALLTF